MVIKMYACGMAKSSNYYAYHLIYLMLRTLKTSPGLLSLIHTQILLISIQNLVAGKLFPLEPHLQPSLYYNLRWSPLPTPELTDPHLPSPSALQLLVPVIPFLTSRILVTFHNSYFNVQLWAYVSPY